jgi:histidine triad (HIT) family protein
MVRTLGTRYDWTAMTTCLFCNIVARTTAAQIVFENDDVVAFTDIRPVAPAHALVIPKKHIVGVHEATSTDALALGQVLLAARDVAEQLGLAESGYRLVINQGPDAGQSVFHLHCHVLGGRPMAWPPG